jgi:hypothetical protein
MTAEKLAALLRKEIVDLRSKKMLEMEAGLTPDAYQKHVEFCKALKEFQSIVTINIEKLRADNR